MARVTPFIIEFFRKEAVDNDSDAEIPVEECVIKAKSPKAARAWADAHLPAVRATAELNATEGEDQVVYASVAPLNSWLRSMASNAKSMAKVRKESVVYCQDCGKEWHEFEMGGAPKNLGERVAKGEPWPAGECPECGALCQPVSQRSYQGPTYGP